MSTFPFRFIENYNLAIEQIKALRAKNKRFRQFMEVICCNARSAIPSSHLLTLVYKGGGVY